jgi:hypothetical protein
MTDLKAQKCVGFTRNHNPRVGGASPSSAATYFHYLSDGCRPRRTRGRCLPGCILTHAFLRVFNRRKSFDLTRRIPGRTWNGLVSACLLAVILALRLSSFVGICWLGLVPFRRGRNSPLARLLCIVGHIRIPRMRLFQRTLVPRNPSSFRQRKPPRVGRGKCGRSRVLLASALTPAART